VGTGKYVEGKSTPTTEETDLCDDDTTRRRSLTFIFQAW
jgi:hypothetical protein